ncbi:MAG: glycosyltransferase family 4 protein [Thermoprotei archaeon]
MNQPRVVLIAHGLGSGTISGEASVARQGLLMLEERGIDHVIVTFSKPADPGLTGKSVWVLPLRLEKFDKYRRVLTVLKARSLRPKVFLNFAGYPDKLSEIAPQVIYGGVFAFLTPSKYDKSLLWKAYYYPYKRLVLRDLDELRKAKIVLNSHYSVKALKRLIDVEPKVIYPPIYNYDLYSKSYHEGEREKSIVTIGRFERGKTLERSVEVAKRTGLKLYLIGSLSDRKYYEELRSKAKDLNVVFMPNASAQEIAAVLSKASVYFHPTEGEHFGTPIAESMVAGLIPVVPVESGGYELAPEFGYQTIDEAVEKVKQALGSSVELRREMRRRVEGLRPEAFRERLFEEVEEYL